MDTQGFQVQAGREPDSGKSKKRIPGADAYESVGVGTKACSSFFFFFLKVFIWLCCVLVAAHDIFSCGIWDLVPLTRH